MATKHYITGTSRLNRVLAGRHDKTWSSTWTMNSCATIAVFACCIRAEKQQFDNSAVPRAVAADTGCQIFIDVPRLQAFRIMAGVSMLCRLQGGSQTTMEDIGRPSEINSGDFPLGKIGHQHSVSFKLISLAGMALDNGPQSHCPFY